MTIRENVASVAARIKAEGAAGQFTKDVKAKALSAILGGSKEWVEYMRLFAAPDKPQQLARLIPTDSSGQDDGMNLTRAYLVAAGPCTPDTVDNMENAVTGQLDIGLAP